MNWLKTGAIGVFLMVIITAALFTVLTPSHISDSADEQEVLTRVEQAEGIMENLTFKNISMVGNRVLVQSEYIGEENKAPAGSAEWHKLAQTTANRLYQDVIRNRGVEVQIYQENKLRSVAVAGI